MSYILDALLKADQERQRNATPTLNSVHAAQTVEQAGPRKRWPYLLLALLSGGLLAGGVLLGLRPAAPEHSSQAQAATPSSATLAKRPESGAAQPGPEPLSQTAPLPAATVTGSATAPSVAARTTPSPTTVATMTPEKAPADARRHASPAAAPTAPAPSAETGAVASITPPADIAPSASLKRSNRIIDIGELPPELRKEVEESVTVAGSSFSADNDERMAIINDRARRAGDEVVAGMKLETILPDGIVLNYKGYRFRTGMY